MDKLNFEMALDMYYDILEDQPKGVSSLSISFYEDWAGTEHTYILDSLYPTVDPRVHSLDTAHVVEHVSLPAKREDLTIEMIADLTEDLKVEFWSAYAKDIQESPRYEKAQKLKTRNENLMPETLQGLAELTTKLRGEDNDA